MCALSPTPGLTLSYEPCPGGARLTGLFGNEPCPVLPETVGGLPLVEIGDYCFAGVPRGQAALAASALHETIPGAPPCEHRIGGSFLAGIVLPDALETIGNCAFYDCRALAWIGAGSRIKSFGSDVFLNTFALHILRLRSAPNVAGSVFRFVNSLSAALAVFFMPDGVTVQGAALYPEYWEDAEETPAHILLHAYSGQGYHYRQCFLSGVPLWGEYDAVFPQACAEDAPAAMAMLAFLRLRFPWELAPKSELCYRNYLTLHGVELVPLLSAHQDFPGLAALLSLSVLSDATITALAAQQAAAGNAAFAAALTDALQPALSPVNPNRYSFDF